MSTLTDAQQECIRGLAASGSTNHAAFIYGVLREPLVDAVYMAAAMREVPLTEASMTYIAEHWHDGTTP